ncbi:DEAD/DEAH box helicase family protein [Actinoplanes sp. NPDC049668]|uniref:DEAD/DEAH box helicase family protein n=1 Tax=unclassified Actinoplanes TaxID=2626549 RepID=UPI0033AB00E1
MGHETLRLALRQLLTVAPGQDKHELQRGLTRLGLRGIDTRQINQTLYRGRANFACDGATPPRWRLAGETRRRGSSYAGNEPRAWQREALAAWRAEGRRGVVEAVTGTGKTTVGILAAAEAVDAGERVLILVPGTELLEQWHAVLRRDLPTLRIGRLGSGHRDSLSDHDVVVAVVNSAAIDPVVPRGYPALIVADEVHRYGAPFFARALSGGFGARLGLTATFTREDDLLEQNLMPYFGPVVASCSYQRGLADSILAPFRIAFVGADFTAAERERHDECESRMKDARNRLVFDHGCPAEPFGEFIKAVNRLAQPDNVHAAACRVARKYLAAFSMRRRTLADCQSKYGLLADLAPAFAVANRGLVFGESKVCAVRSAEVLTACGVPATSMTSALPKAERRRRLDDFRQGRVAVLTAPKVLDEGIDVPEADLGIVMAASSSKRQMIQRLGRVIRPKSGGGPATFFVAFVRGTAEDPGNDAHKDFREALTEVAQEVKYFGRAARATELLEWHIS